MTTQRPTASRLAEIRRIAELHPDGTYAALIAELDAVTAERDEARAVSEDPTTAPTTAHRARGDE
jgi:hypothetical protein